MGISMQVARGSVSLGRRCAARRLVVRASVAEAPVAAETAAPQVPAMDDVINVCKRRGFIFQSSDVYGGFAGFFDYGPLGVELRQNIKRAWWKDMVHRRDDIVGLDSSIISSPEVWKASGHVAGFSDPMVDCKESKLRYRADQLFWGRAEVDGETIGYVSVLESGTMEAEALATAEKMKRKMGRQGTLALSELRDYTEVCAAEALANSAWPPSSDAPPDRVRRRRARRSSSSSHPRRPGSPARSRRRASSTSCSRRMWARCRMRPRWHTSARRPRRRARSASHMAPP